MYHVRTTVGKGIPARQQNRSSGAQSAGVTRKSFLKECQRIINLETRACYKFQKDHHFNRMTFHI